MSEKLRNVIRNGYMRNFSTNVIERYIIIDDDNLIDNEKNQFVKEINESLWEAIQAVNIEAKNRILPFIVVRRVEKVSNDMVRIIINDTYDDYGDGRNGKSYNDYLDENSKTVDIKELSHLINFKTLAPRRRVQVCDNLIPGNAKLIIDRKYQIGAAVDIFLDIAMFNSIDFLKAMSIDERHEFNLAKFNYAMKYDVGTYYECYKKAPPEYWSLAFTARINERKIGAPEYVAMWDSMLKELYPDKINEIKTGMYPHEQIQKHRDIDNLEDKYKDPSFWSNYEPGDYLFFRINKGTDPEERRMRVAEMFKIPQFHIGATNILPIDKYYLPFINKQMQELVISAFKIVVH